MMPRRKLRLAPKPRSLTREYERALAANNNGGRYTLRLYVSGATPRSLRSIESIKRICEAHLKDRFVLEIIDVYQNPQLVQQDQIVAAPTLIRKLPLPVRRLIGDLSNQDKVLMGLGLVRRQ